MGSVDKISRVLLAAVFGLLIYFEVVQGVLAYVLAAISAIFVLTSLMRFCPLYTVLGLNTCKVHHEK